MARTNYYANVMECLETFRKRKKSEFCDPQFIISTRLWEYAISKGFAQEIDGAKYVCGRKTLVSEFCDPREIYYGEKIIDKADEVLPERRVFYDGPAFSLDMEVNLKDDGFGTPD